MISRARLESTTRPWRDERVTWQYERTWYEQSQSLHASVFLAAGEDEQIAGGRWRNENFSDEAIRAVRQVDNLRDLVDTLRARNYVGLHLDSVIVPGEYHLTVFPAAFTRGFQWMIERLT